MVGCVLPSNFMATLLIGWPSAHCLLTSWCLLIVRDQGWLGGMSRGMKVTGKICGEGSYADRTQIVLILFLPSSSGQVLVISPQCNSSQFPRIAKSILIRGQCRTTRAISQGCTLEVCFLKSPLCILFGFFYLLKVILDTR